MPGRAPRSAGDTWRDADDTVRALETAVHTSVAAFAVTLGGTQDRLFARELADVAVKTLTTFAPGWLEDGGRMG